jgi:transposase
MQLDPASLPDDVETLRRMMAAQAITLASTQAELAAAKSGLIAKTLEIEKLKMQLARLRRMQFGHSSEKLDREIAQLELRLEGLEAEEAQATPAAVEPSPAENAKPVRRPLPEHLERREVLHEAACACPACGGELRPLGEDVTELLEYEPARFHVVRHVRPKFSCRRCETITQAAMPDLPIERGRPGPGLLAHVLVSKYADHLPLYRQSDIYARDGVELDRSTLAEWVGRSSALLMPLVEEQRRQVMASPRLHGDDTPVPVLSPGLGRTKTGRLWVYVRDDRPHGGPAPPAAVYFYSPDRKGEHPQAHLASFAGHLHADAYAGFDALYAADRSPGRSPRSPAGRMQGGSSTTSMPPIRAPWPRRRWTGSGSLRHRSRHPRTAARRTAMRPAGPSAAGSPCPQGVARCHPGEAVRQVGTGAGDALCARPLAGAAPLSRRRHPGDRQQRRRTGPARRGARPQELAVCRL